ncbi:MAG: response regulator [Spirochaetales bacterium]|nr:response regulator [Spirochaetales bacterium]
MIGKRDDGTSYKVLIVDDSLFVQHLVAKLLEAEGFNIIDTASHGREAIEKYKSFHPDIDIVTMDVTMPGMHGVEAMNEIRKIDPEACVVIVSALGKTDLMKKALLDGAAHYLVKPITKDKLLQCMQYAIDSRITL